MKKYPCPSCGAEIPFRTSIAAHGVCPYCRTMVVRMDEALQKTGEMAQLPEDMSPFQIGTEGRFRGVRFGIVGRMRIGWEDGAWNEWFIVSDDGRKGWLAEAQGFYAPCFQVTDLDEETHKSLDSRFNGRFNDGASEEEIRATLGVKLKINDIWYKVVDVKNASCVGSEGELPFSAPQGRKTVTIDLVRSGVEDGFASIEVSKNGDRVTIEVFEGGYVDWQDLGCKYFRTFEGW